jgi:1,4-alpha-glucan branching enzyme
MNKSNQSKINGTKTKSIRIEFSHPTAQTVNIAGTFNDWRPEVTQMFPLGDGLWGKELALPHGSYEYLFVADGQWIADPSTKETVPNPFGGVNSVLRVEG